MKILIEKRGAEIISVEADDTKDVEILVIERETEGFEEDDLETMPDATRAYIERRYPVPMRDGFAEEMFLSAQPCDNLKVVWETLYDGFDPWEAAARCWRSLREPGALCCQFRVIDPQGRIHEIDLAAPPKEEEGERHAA